MTSEMSKFSVLLMSLLVVCDRSSGVRSYRSYMYVYNGQYWGSWSQKEMCPAGMYATGFSLKVEEPGGYILFADETAVNGIHLHCTDVSGSHEDNVTVESKTGSWGKWSDIQWCSDGFLTSFQLRVQLYQGNGDNTAVNNIRFTCSNGDTLEGSGTDWGYWGH